MRKEFLNAYIQAMDLDRTKESDLVLQINKEVKQILEWEYR